MHDDQDKPQSVPPGFAAALADALRQTWPAGTVSIWEGQERIGVTLRDVVDQDQATDALARALEMLDAGFNYFPGIDVSIWRR